MSGLWYTRLAWSSSSGRRRVNNSNEPPGGDFDETLTTENGIGSCLTRADRARLENMFRWHDVRSSGSL